MSDEHVHFWRKHTSLFGSLVAVCDCGGTMAGALRESDFGYEAKR